MINKYNESFSQDSILISTLQSEIELYKQKLLSSEKNYKSLENNLTLLLNENHKLNETLHMENKKLTDFSSKYNYFESNIQELSLQNSELKKDNEILANALNKNRVFDLEKKKADWEKNILLNQEKNINQIEESFKKEKELLERFNDELIKKIKKLENEKQNLIFEQENQIRILNLKISEIENNIQISHTNPPSDFLNKFFLICIENERLHHVLHEFSLQNSFYNQESAEPLINDLSRKLNYLIMENDRLNSIIFNRCCEMSTSP